MTVLVFWNQGSRQNNRLNPIFYAQNNNASQWQWHFQIEVAKRLDSRETNKISNHKSPAVSFILTRTKAPI